MRTITFPSLNAGTIDRTSGLIVLAEMFLFAPTRPQVLGKREHADHRHSAEAEDDADAEKSISSANPAIDVP